MALNELTKALPPAPAIYRQVDELREDCVRENDDQLDEQTAGTQLLAVNFFPAPIYVLQSHASMTYVTKLI